MNVNPFLTSNLGPKIIWLIWVHKSGKFVGGDCFFGLKYIKFRLFKEPSSMLLVKEWIRLFIVRYLAHGYKICLYLYATILANLMGRIGLYKLYCDALHFEFRFPRCLDRRAFLTRYTSESFTSSYK